MLVIFVVETTEQNDSDKMFLNKYINTCFPQMKNSPETILHWIYLNGKGNYKKRSILLKIDSYIERYKRFHPDKNDVFVFYCVDVDDVCQQTTVEENKRINSELQAFCEEKEYYYVWFYKTIEDVFLGKTVKQPKDKKREAEAFMRKKIDNDILNSERFKMHCFSEVKKKTTNLGFVLGSLLSDSSEH